MPPTDEWDYKPPKSENGGLHPDAYWFAVILDIRAREANEELWIEVSWYYSKRNLEVLARQTHGIRPLLSHPYDTLV
jgi:hypothetical protein